MLSYCLVAPKMSKQFNFFITLFIKFDWCQINKKIQVGIHFKATSEKVQGEHQATHRFTPPLNMSRYSVKLNINDGCYCPVLEESTRTHAHTHTYIHKHTPGLSYEPCEVVSPYVNRKSGGKTRYRGNPLFKCQAVRAILSLLFLFPLFCTSQGSDSPPSSLLRCLLGVRACGRDCVGVHVPAGGSHS